MNGDGRPDLIVANIDSNTVSVLLNTTSHVEATPSGVPEPVFPQAASPATGSRPVSVAVADLNGDGRPDLIVANLARQHGVGAAEHDGAGRQHASFAAQRTFANGVRA